jgi:hypothetical protein
VLKETGVDPDRGWLCTVWLVWHTQVKVPPQPRRPGAFLYSFKVDPDGSAESRAVSGVVQLQWSSAAETEGVAVAQMQPCTRAPNAPCALCAVQCSPPDPASSRMICRGR